MIECQPGPRTSTPRVAAQSNPESRYNWRFNVELVNTRKNVAKLLVYSKKRWAKNRRPRYIPAECQFWDVNWLNFSLGRHVQVDKEMYVIKFQSDCKCFSLHFKVQTFGMLVSPSWLQLGIWNDVVKNILAFLFLINTSKPVLVARNTCASTCNGIWL